MPRVLAASLLVLGCSVQPLAAQFRPLPEGALGRVEFHGVRGEVAVTLLVDSATAASLVPEGFRPLTLERIAGNDPTTAALLAERPHLRTSVPGVLGFTRLDSLRVDGGAPAAAEFAFWWLGVLPDSALDERALGDPTVDAAFWTGDAELVGMLEAYWPQADLANVSVDEDEDGEWRVKLELPEGSVFGTCRPAGPGSDEEDAKGAYMTLWSAGPRATSFTVVTSFGQTTTPCEASWEAVGSHPIAAAVRATLEEPPPWMGTTLVAGWHGLARVYRR